MTRWLAADEPPIIPYGTPKGELKMRRLSDRCGRGGTRYTTREKLFSVGDD